MIRIVAAREARIDGTLTAAGGAGEHASGGGAGGAIFLACGAFSGGAAACLDTKGGAGSNWQTGSSKGGGGGGGRIAVAVGFSDHDLENLIAGAPVKRLTASPTHSDYEGSICVTNGVGYYLPPHAYGATSGTWTFLRIAPPPGSVLLVR